MNLVMKFQMEPANVNFNEKNVFVKKKCIIGMQICNEGKGKTNNIC